MKYAKKNKQKPLVIAVCVATVLLAIAVIVLVGLIRKETPSDTPAENPNSTEATVLQPAGSEETAGETEEVSKETEETSAVTEPASDDKENEKPTEPEETKKPSSENNDQKNTEPTSPAVQTDLAVDTPYATLYFPLEWKPYLHVDISEGDIFAVKFVAKLNSGKSQDLFTVGFGGAADTAVGAVKASNGKYVNVQMELFDFSPDTTWSEEEKTIVYNMRDALNHVISRLQLEEVTQEQESTEPVDDVETMKIEKPHITLFYPARWKDTLKLNIGDDSVEFYCAVPGREEKLLFVVYFGGSRGTTVALVQSAAGNSVEVRIETQQIDLDDSWTEDQREIVYAMQEDINFLLERLS